MGETFLIGETIIIGNEDYKNFDEQYKKEVEEVLKTGEKLNEISRERAKKGRENF